MATTDFLDFDLAIRPLPLGWGAAVVGSPVGPTAVVPVAIPFTEPGAGDPLAGSGGARRVPVADGTRTVEEVGAGLFDAVFRGPVRNAWSASRDLAARQGAGLRVRLLLGSGRELEDLPWECLYDGDARRFLSLSRRGSVVRHLDLPGRIAPLPVRPPLRILALLPDPPDPGLVDGEGEWGRLHESLEDLQRSGGVLLRRAPGGTLDALQRRLDDERPHVLHVLGHGGSVVGAAGGVLLHGHPAVRLLVLGVGAPGTDRADDRPSPAPRLVRDGVPAVVSLRSSMTARAARTFWTAFYDSVAAGRPLDVAMTAARSAVRHDVSPSEWAVPVLTSRVPDGRVFDLDRDARSVPPVVAPRPAPAVPPPELPPPAEEGTPLPAGVTRVLDDDVRFSVFRPRALPVEEWTSLLVLAHKSQPYVVDAVRGVIDPMEKVHRLVEKHFDAPVDVTSSDSRHELGVGSAVRVVPDLPGVLCNPPAVEFTWFEDVHEGHFRLWCPAGMAGRKVRGSIRIWCGPLILGELFVAIPVAGPQAVAEVVGPAPAPGATIDRYRKIFPSYSHRDGELIEQFEAVVHTLGDRYLRDVLTLKAGERWDERLLELIAEADVFQLFWSHNSMRSPHCRREWEQALTLGRPSFVRPVYWEEPLPEDPSAGLPPDELRMLHFTRFAVPVPRAAGGGGSVTGSAPTVAAAADDGAVTASAPSVPASPPPVGLGPPAPPSQGHHRPAGPAQQYGQQSPHERARRHGGAWPGPPADPGAPAGGYGGGPGAAPPAPRGGARSRRRRGLLAAVVAVAFAVVGGLFVMPLSGPGPTAAIPRPPAASSSPQVEFELTDTLDPGTEASEVATVYSGGTLVGTLEVDAATPTDTLAVVGPEGTVAYELEVSSVLLDGSEVRCAGRGSIAVYEGARYSVHVDRAAAGCTASLQ